MIDLDLFSWGSISAYASARGRQCYYLEPGVAPIKTGRFLVTWRDDNETLWWDGALWSDRRDAAMEYYTQDYADEALRMARRTPFPGSSCGELDTEEMV